MPILKFKLTLNGPSRYKGKLSLSIAHKPHKGADQNNVTEKRQ